MKDTSLFNKNNGQKRITYLTPVLVRDTDQDLWEVDIFITRDMKDEYSYHCKGTFGNNAFRSKVTWLS